MHDTQSFTPTATAPPRSKMELMYQEILRESQTLVNRIEEMAKQQEQIQQAIQAAPVAIRQAGQDAANQAADHAGRTLLEATRSIASATSDLRVAARAASSAVPSMAWRTGLLCAVSAFFGSVVCAVVIVLL